MGRAILAMVGRCLPFNTDGTGFRLLHHFSAEMPNGVGIETNSDGYNPDGTLILSGNTLHGTAYYGGANDNGTCLWRV
jgi:hypothetical protein